MEISYGWEAFGVVAHLIFFTRVIALWTASERARKPVLPVEYWYLSLVGGCMLIVFDLHIIHDTNQGYALLLGHGVGFLIYARSLFLEFAYRRREDLRKELGFLDKTYPWPTISIIVPVHNEEKSLDRTLECMTTQHYPGPAPQIVVALNGCEDNSRQVAETYLDRGVVIVESEKSGMSFGKNLGAAEATGDILIFVDADTFMPDSGFQAIVEAFHGKDRAIAAVPGRPDRGMLVIRSAFWIANHYARKHRVLTPGPVMAIQRTLFEELGGLDESLPQGTSSDLFLRAQQAGAQYLYVEETAAVTSVRRFQEKGILTQLLDWRSNHKRLKAGDKEDIAQKEYDVVR